MTKALDPHLKALKACTRVLATLDQKGRDNLVRYLFAVNFETTQDQVSRRFSLWPLLDANDQPKARQP